MKKFLVLIISCCFALLLAACSDKDGGNDGNDEKTEYETGAVFQVCNLGDTATDEKYFENTDGVKTYITENFADCYYFCIFGDNDRFYNISAVNPPYGFGANVNLSSAEGLRLYDISYNPLTEKYSLKESTVYSTNTEIAIDLRLGANENYNVKINLIPKDAQTEILELNKPIKNTVKADSTEYFNLSPEISGPCDLTVSGSGDFEVGLYIDGNEHIVGSLMSGQSIKASYFINSGREYCLAVHSYGGDSEVNIEFKNADTLELGKEAEYEIGDSKYFVFTPQISSEVIFGTLGEGAFEITLYDDDNKFLAKTTDTDNFSNYVEKGKKYFVLVKNYSHTEDKVKIYTRLNPIKLKYGIQGGYQATEENCYSFTPNVTAEYTFGLSDNEFRIYDSEWKRVEEANGKYAFEEGRDYFVIITGSVKEFTVDIGLIYSTDAAGVIPDGGYVIVKFVPDVTANYIVDGAENVEWYSSDLLKGSSFLTKGKTYFVKISGESGGNYSINKVIVYTDIAVNRMMNLFDGAYRFTVESDGDYTITFYTANNPIEFNLYNANGEKLKEYSGGHGKITVNLDRGEYTFDLSVSNATSAGIIINKV